MKDWSGLHIGSFNFVVLLQAISGQYFREFIAYAKPIPGKLNTAAGGSPSSKLKIEMEAGFDANNTGILYKGGAAAQRLMSMKCS